MNTQFIDEIKEVIRRKEFDIAERRLAGALQGNQDAIYIRALMAYLEKVKRTEEIDSEIGRAGVPAQVEDMAVPPPVIPYSAALHPSLVEESGRVHDDKAEIILNAWRSGDKVVNAVFQAYMGLLYDFWQDGIITAEEEERLRVYRKNLDITSEQHGSLEQHVRHILYLRSIRNAGSVSAPMLHEFRDKFRISAEEMKRLHRYESAVIRSIASEGLVIIADEDQQSADSTAHILEERGYHCVRTESGEELLSATCLYNPDCVISDIAFGPRAMNGFMVYERFRMLMSTGFTPFIILSNVRIRSMMLYAKQIGVDAFLPKPSDEEELAAVVLQKIARYRRLRSA